jgi:hypothetical protein
LAHKGTKARRGRWAMLPIFVTLNLFWLGEPSAPRSYFLTAAIGRDGTAALNFVTNIDKSDVCFIIIVGGS